MRVLRALLALLVVAAVAGACGLGGLGAGARASGSCADLLGGACTEQMERIGARHPGARQIDLECSPVPCTRAAGQGNARITRADGSVVNEVWSYTGDPGPVPAPLCVGLALDVCRTAATAAVNDVEPSKRVVAVDVRCQPRCTEMDGETSITITMADGSTHTSGMGWSGGPP